MTKSSVLWGAGLACALGGAIAGNALGSTPVLDRPTLESFYQSHADAPVERATATPPLPDHYPLVTRDGTVPVGELGMRGLYSQARFRGYAYAADPAGAGDAFPDLYPAQELRSSETVEAPAGPGDPVPAGAQRQADASGPSPPLELAGGPASVGVGQARLIDVRAALAMN